MSWVLESWPGSIVHVLTWPNGSLVPGASLKSTDISQFSCLQVFWSISLGLASGAPGIENTKSPES